MLKGLKGLFLASFNYTLTIKGGGRELKVPVINNVGRANLDLHEEHMRVVFSRLYTANTVLIDIGANIGQTLIKYALIAGNDCHYIGFEPNVKAAAYVDEIIARNKLSNAMIVPVGLGSGKRLDMLLMTSASSVDPGASINVNIRDASFYGFRKVIALSDADTAFQELGIDEKEMIVKIDVEGAENEVINGMRRTLTSVRPVVVLEILPPSNFSAEVNRYRLSQAAALQDTMKTLDFAMFRIGDKGELDGGRPTDDYLFVPTERREELKARWNAPSRPLPT